MQREKCDGWYHEVSMNPTPVSLKRFNKNGCVWFRKQCYSDSLLTEAISVVNIAGRLLANIVETRQIVLARSIDVNSPQTKSALTDLCGPKKERSTSKRSIRNKGPRMKVSSVSRLPNDSQQETPKKPSRMARYISVRKKN